MSSSADPAQASTTKPGKPGDAPDQVGSQVFNVPNSLSMMRLILAIGVGILIEYHFYTTAWITFIVAASTDFLDGYWARRFNQITKLGRILDPFVDKIIITAAMVALVGVPASGVAAWMVTVIIGRELLVTSLRGMVEGRGGDFSARWLGKWKMVFQCVAVVACLMVAAAATPPAWLLWTARVSLWLAVFMTVASGIDYIAQIIKISRKPAAH